jgi:tRNA dimethylallyltransferase
MPNIPKPDLAARPAPITLVAGATASGKSALALRLARAWDAEIVNADAIQIYRDLSVLSARPSAEEEAAAPHHLFGVADAAESWSVGRWLTEALAALDAIAARGRPAIVVGGTGLYFRALTQGLAAIPTVPSQVRADAASAWDRLGEDGVRAALRVQDPEAEARISPGDRQRLLRAVEVFAATGRSLTAWQAETEPPVPSNRWRALVLEPPREVLYARCDARLQTMIDAGALDEVRALAARNLDPMLSAMKAVGLRELAAHLAGDLSLDDALRLAQQETRRFAKRQLTWFRNQTPGWERVKDDIETFAS